MRLSLSKLLNLTLPKAGSAERVVFLKAQPFAHRGLHGGPIVENSRAACLAAIDMGHGIELDVQLASSGEPVVFHDALLDRLTTETGRLADRNADELAAIKLAGTDETIPLLSQILALVAGRVPLLIEIKTDGASLNLICLAVRRALEGYRGDAAVMSFDPGVARWFGEHAKRLPRGLVMTMPPQPTRVGRMQQALKARLALARAKPDFVAYNIDHLPGALPSALRARGLPLLTWTVRSAAQEHVALGCADEIIYEKPSD